jgi:hypothetical protein
MKSRLASAAALLLVSVCAAGCKRLAETAEEKAIERSSGGQATLTHEDGGGFRVVTDGAAMAMGAFAQVPEDFPKAVPLYPGATPLFSSSNSVTGKSAWSVQLQTPDTKEQVVAYYKGHMSGFTEATAMDMGTTSMRVYQSPKYDVSLGVTAAGDKTVLTLNTTSK